MNVKIFSSVGKKEIVAVSGLALLGFLALHLLGNSTVYFGRTHFEQYAEHLHGLGILDELRGSGPVRHVHHPHRLGDVGDDREPRRAAGEATPPDARTRPGFFRG
ncbi:MAG: hypothetical protein M5R36_15750 [Deltaproteobacteria bacterium]|nr:hypothetical protein [Deltaproteobacteria bacterium]